MVKKDIATLLKEKSSIRLEIGGGKDPNPGFVNIDILDLPQVDIVWDIERTPWPLPSNIVSSAVASHVLEHLTPGFGDKRLQGLVELLVAKKVFTDKEANEYMGLPGSGFINVMNELWRVMKPSGRCAFVCPNAESPGMFQDPTHQNFINNNTMRYFAPLDPSGLYQFYRPKPWDIKLYAYQTNGNIEAIMEKLPMDKTYEGITLPRDQVVAESQELNLIREVGKM